MVGTFTCSTTPQDVCSPYAVVSASSVTEGLGGEHPAWRHTVVQRSHAGKHDEVALVPVMPLLVQWSA